MEQPRLVQDGPGAATRTTFDEASLERSKGFVKALQELKNLRPQLYSAAEYCEKSYLHSDQKQMVLDNLKDYAVRAVINAVDHLGTVAYKLTHILDQQASDVDSMDLKLRCLSQQVVTCQTYTNKQGLRQQQLLAVIPKHHRRYILPNSAANKKVHFSPTLQSNPRLIHSQARPRVHPAGSPGSKTLSWHLASETTTPDSKPTPNSAPSSQVQKTAVKSSSAFQLLDKEERIQSKLTTTNQPQHYSSRNLSAPSGLTYKDAPTRPPPPAKSYQNNTASVHNQIIRAPPRTKSMLSAFFVKHKAPKLNPPAGTVA